MKKPKHDLTDVRHDPGTVWHLACSAASSVAIANAASWT